MSNAAGPRLLPRAWLAGLSLLWLVLLVGNPLPAAAQARDGVPAYWRHDATGEIGAVLPADLDGDGFLELIAIVDGLKIEVVRSDGGRYWPEPWQPGDALVAVQVWPPDFPGGESDLLVLTEKRLLRVTLQRTITWDYLLPDDFEPQRLLVLQKDPPVAAIQFEDGTVQLVDGNGQEIRSHRSRRRPADPPPALWISADLDQTGTPELYNLYATSTQAGMIVRIDGTPDPPAWELAWADALTAVATVPFGPDGRELLAVGSRRGNLLLLDGNGELFWQPRTLNATITALAAGTWNGEPMLVAGTDTGKLVAFSADGGRLWDKAVCPTPDGGWHLPDRRCPQDPSGTILSITAPDRAIPRPVSQPVALTFLLDTGQSAELILLDSALDPLAAWSAAALPHLPHLIDINRDGLDELLRVTFGSMELLNPGTFARSLIPAWDFRLISLPVAVQVVDFNHDGSQELLIGARNSIYHLDANGVAIWVAPMEGEVSHLALLESPAPAPPPLLPLAEAPGELPGSLPETLLVVGYNTSTTGSDLSFSRGKVALMRPDSSLVWESPLALPGRLTALHLDSDTESPLLLLATDQRVLTAFRLSLVGEGENRTWAARFVWSRETIAPVTAIARLERDSGYRLVAVSERDIRMLDDDGNTQYYFNRESVGEAEMARSVCATPPDLLFLVVTGTDEGLECLGRSMAVWSLLLGSPNRPIQRQTTRHLYTPSNQRTWSRSLLTDALVAEGGGGGPVSADVETRKTSFPNVTAFLSGDLTGDGRNDFIMGQDSGRIWLDLNETVGDGSGIAFDAAILQLVSLHPAANAPPELVVTTANSIVRLLRFQPNYPPLLTAPVISRAENQYTIQIRAIDIEQARIAVDLEVLNPATREWERVGESRYTDANATELIWGFVPPPGGDNLRYRFVYADGNEHRGVVEPLPGPPPIVRSSLPFWVAGSTLLAGGALVSGWLYLQQQQQPASQARRFYRELQAARHDWLDRLRARYDAVEGSPEWLLSLANVARREQDPVTAALADGFYLLENQPEAGLPVLLSGVARLEPEQEPSADSAPSADLVAALRLTWQLLQAPSLTQMSLMHADLLRSGGPILAELLPAFATLRDSERVESADDRLTALNDAAALLRPLEETARARPVTLANTLVRAIAERTLGVVGSEIETLRGRANLDVLLTTLRVAPAEKNRLVLEIHNSGRAAAEQVTVTLEPGAAHPVGAPRRTIPSLAPGRTRRVEFDVVLPVGRRSRVVFRIAFSDRQRADKQFEYANVVDVLAPVREFTPLINPYAPGTPLRRNSPLFFGRDDLFAFIAGEAPRLAQQHVLIIVGQRRTGKTSALLRLGQHLPPHLLPVYIDCQSLGVLPGLGAFFQDIVWLIADAMQERGFAIEPPELETLPENPGTWFQHTFIPAVLRELPSGTQLVLVLDEFEALENLVQDGILPRTLFPYLRHLMQHSHGLSFIFVGTRRLEELTTDYWSVLFNIALYKEIDYLEQEAARALITQPVAPALVYDDLALGKIWRLTAGHPYFLQLVCYSLVKRANAQRTGYVTISDVNATVSEMLSLGEVHFAFIWQRSTSAERAILIAVAHLVDKETPVRPAELVQALEPFGMALSPALVTRALESLVQRKIMRVVSDGPTALYELQLGLVGMWIEQTKSLAGLYAES
jgi:hypothetical protein